MISDEISSLQSLTYKSLTKSYVSDTPVGPTGLDKESYTMFELIIKKFINFKFISLGSNNQQIYISLGSIRTVLMIYDVAVGRVLFNDLRCVTKIIRPKYLNYYRY